MYKILHGIMLLFFLGVEWLDFMVAIYLTFKTTKLFIPPAVYENSTYSVASLILYVVSLLILVSLVGV